MNNNGGNNHSNARQTTAAAQHPGYFLRRETGTSIVVYATQCVLLAGHFDGPRRFQLGLTIPRYFEVQSISLGFAPSATCYRPPPFEAMICFPQELHVLQITLIYTRYTVETLIYPMPNKINNSTPI